jgi:serine-type D-Ala-D-Ala carboxypeptidase (penicillin-binding protein 5/6)
MGTMSSQGRPDVHRDIRTEHPVAGRWRAVGLVLGAILCLAVLVQAIPAFESGGAPAVAGPSTPPVARASPAVERAPRPPVADRPAIRTVRVPKFAARAAIVLDLATGTILLARHPDARMPVASLTKIMTAMLVQASTRPGDVVRVSRKAASQEPTNVELRPGWRLRAWPLIAALMVHSANDAAVALAEHVAGSVQEFDRWMNGQAAALGMRATHFMSPNGLDDRGLSSARDVATMTRWALGSKAFDSVVGLRHYTLRLPSGKRLKLTNLNDLLFTYPGAIGVKTGYTRVAGWSIAAAASRGRLSVLAVVLGDSNKPFNDGRRLLNYGFAVLRSHQDGARPQG